MPAFVAGGGRDSMPALKHLHRQAEAPDYGIAPFWTQRRPEAYRPSQAAASALRSAGLILGDVLAFLVIVALVRLVAEGVGYPIWPAGVAADPAMLTKEAAVVLAAALIYMLAHGHYRRRLPYWFELRQVIEAAGLAAVCSGVVAFTSTGHASDVVLIAPWLLFPIAVMAARSLVRRALEAIGVWRLPVVLVGSERDVRQAGEALRSEPRLGYDVVGVVSHIPNASLRAAQRWVGAMREHNAELLVIAFGVEDRPGAAQMEALVRERIPFAVMPQLQGLPVFGSVQTAFVSHDTMLVSYNNNLSKPLARAVKVSFDLAGAAAALLMLSPLLLIIAALVKCDGGPVVFSHTRIGAGGRPFRCLKFRSMVLNGDEVLQRLLETDPAAAAEWAATQKLHDDPRVTWIGNLLRKSSLDELPQLFNVLRLEMSLVGPRPIVQREIQKYAEDIAYYYETRPGLTGLWQVSGRSDTSYAQRVQLDSWYVKNWTLWQDMAILARTIPAVLKQKGAV